MSSVFSSNPLSQMLPQPVLLILSVLCLSLFGAAQDCPLDAAMTIGFTGKSPFHFLFRGSNIHKVTVDWDAKIITKESSFPITHYWQNWIGTKVTRAWSWKSDAAETDDYTSGFPNAWPAVIGDHQQSHFMTLDRTSMLLNKDRNMYFWDTDSLHRIPQWEKRINDRDRPLLPQTRGIYLSVYEPGWLWVQNYYSVGEKVRYYLDIQPKRSERDVQMHVGSASELHGGNIGDGARFFRNFNDVEMQLIGILNVAWAEPTSSNVYDVKIVVFVKHKNKTKHCFGYMSESAGKEHCAQPGDYKETDIELFGCGEPATPAKTATTTTTAPVEAKTTAEVTSETPEMDEPIFPPEVVIAGIAGVVVLILAILVWRFVSSKKQPSELKKGPSKFGGSDLGKAGLSKTVRSAKAKSSGSESGSETDTKEGSESEKETAPLLKKQPSGVKQSKSTVKSGIGAKSGVKSAVKSDVKSAASLVSPTLRSKE